MKISKIFDNYQIKLICLLLATVMWLYATRGTETVGRFMATILQDERGKVTFLGVPVNLVGPREQWKANPGKVSLEVRCLEAEVEMGEFQVEVILTSDDEGNGQVALTAENVVLPKGLIFLKAKPNKLRIAAMP